jgi:hypothetical protein
VSTSGGIEGDEEVRIVACITCSANQGGLDRLAEASGEGWMLLEPRREDQEYRAGDQEPGGGRGRNCSALGLIDGGDNRANFGEFLSLVVVEVGMQESDYAEDSEKETNGEDEALHRADSTTQISTRKGKISDTPLRRIGEGEVYY